MNKHGERERERHDAEESFSAAGSTVLEPISQVSSWQRPLINTIPAGS